MTRVHAAFAFADPTLGAAAGFGGVDIVRVVLALGSCLALGIAAAFVLRSRHRLRMQQTEHDGMRLIQSLRIDTRTHVHLIRCGDYDVLMACGATGVAITPLRQGDHAGEVKPSMEASP